MICFTARKFELSFSFKKNPEQLAQAPRPDRTWIELVNMGKVPHLFSAPSDGLSGPYIIASNHIS